MRQLAPQHNAVARLGFNLHMRVQEDQDITRGRACTPHTRRYKTLRDHREKVRNVHHQLNTVTMHGRLPPWYRGYLCVRAIATPSPEMMIVWVSTGVKVSDSYGTVSLPLKLQPVTAPTNILTFMNTRRDEYNANSITHTHTNHVSPRPAGECSVHISLE